MVPFLIYASGAWRFALAVIASAPKVFAAFIRLASRQVAKERLLGVCLAGLTRQELDVLGRDFTRLKLPGLISGRAMQRLSWHQSQGHHCVLISASLETYLVPWGEVHGFDTVIASRLSFSDSGVQDGSLAGENCRGQEKVRRLLDYCPRENIDELYAYGDSSGDAELLALADRSFYRSFGTESSE